VKVLPANFNPSDTDITLPLKPAGTDSNYSLPTLMERTLLHTATSFEGDRFLKIEETVPSEWQVGDIILDLYEVLEILGEGAFGKVYKVMHRGWNTILAVKTLREEFVENKEYKKVFIKECQGWVNLGLHPNIVSCYYVRDLGGLPRIFLEYMEEGSIYDLIKSGKIKELDRIIDMTIQCLDGLSFAHGKGLVHRDIKPANCLVSGEGEVKITDFGIAAGLENPGIIIEDKIPHNKTIITEGGTVGTPAYMPPEQWDHKYGKRGPWSDIYSLGVMLYELCCGKRPFDSGVEHTGVIKMRHISDVPVNPVEINIELPENLSRFILRCIEKEPSKRYESCEEARKELVKIYEEIMGEPYHRKKPEEASLLADGLNNRAISLMDLGQKEEALKVWQEALKADFLHIPSIFNSSLVEWRSGKINDLEVIDRLNNILQERPDKKEIYYFLGLVHLERDDCREAMEKFKEALRVSVNREAIEKLLKKATERLPLSTQLIRAISSEKGELLETLSLNSEGKKAFVSCRTLKKDDFYGAQRTDTGNYHILDTEKGEWIKKRFCHPFWFSAITPDGKWGLSAGGKDFLHLWDLDTDTLVKTFYPPHSEGRSSIALDPDRKYIAEGGKNGIVYIYDTYSGQCVKKLEGHKGPVSVLHFTPDRKHVVSGSQEGDCKVTGRTRGKGKVNIWNIATGQCVRTFEIQEEGDSVNFSSHGKIGVTLNGNELKIWDTEKKICINKCMVKRIMVPSEKISLSDNGNLALIAGGEKKFFLFDTEKGCCRRTFVSNCYNFALSGNGKTALFWEPIFNNSFIHIWKINSLNLSNFYSTFALSFIKKTEEILSFQSHFRKLLEEAEKTIEAGNWNSAIDILSQARNLPGYEVHPDIMAQWRKLYGLCKKTGIKSVQKIKTLKGHRDSLNSMVISNDGKFLVSGSADGAIRVWDIFKGECIKTFQGRKNNAVMSVSLSSDSHFIISGHSDGSINLWDASGGNFVRTFKEHTKFVRGISLSRDGRWLLSGSDDRTAKLWDINSASSIRTFTGFDEDVLRVDFSSDNQTAYTFTLNTMKIWDLPEGKCIGTIKSPGSNVSFDRDSGLALLGGNYDRNINNKNCFRLWDLSSGRCISSFPAGTSVSPVALSKDNRWGFGGDTIWDLSEKKPLRKLESATVAAWSWDGSFLVLTSRNYSINLWMIDWELETVPPSDMDERINPYLINFFNSHIPYGENFKAGNLTEEVIKKGLKRQGKPEWSDKDLKDLWETLKYAGYGYVRPEGIKKELERLKIEGIKPTEEDENQLKLLRGAEENSPEAIMSLLDKGTDINCRDPYGNTPLHLVIKNNRKKDKKKTIEILINRGADPAIRDHSCGLTPLELAGESSFYAPYMEEVMCKKIIEKVEKSAKEGLEEFSLSPLHSLCIKSNYEELKTFPEKEDVNVEDIMSNTPLHYASIRGSRETAKILLKRGANQEAKNIFGKTPLHFAAEKGHESVVDLLIEKKGDVNLKDPAGRTPLHFAAEGRNRKVVEILIKNGAIIDAKDADYKKPLDIAVEKGFLEVIEVLAENMAGKEDSTPLNIAIKHKNREALELMLDRGFDVNGQDVLKRTPLHIAAEEGNVEIAKMLIARGADIDRIYYRMDNMSLEQLKNLGWYIINGANLGKLYGKVDAEKLNYIKSETWQEFVRITY